MDQHQTPQVEGEPDEPDGAARGTAAQPRVDRLKTIGLWCALLALSIALLGGGMMIWRSLQADQAISQLARSAMKEEPAAVAPAVAAAPAGAVPAAIAPVAAPAAAAALEGKRLFGAVPKARARLPLAKSGGKTAQPVQRAASVRAKALARAKLRTEGGLSKRKPAAGTVQQRLARCKAKAGEAAAACYARACRSYARKAPVCINDERRR